MAIERTITLNNVTGRASLISELDCALCVHGFRVVAGTYEVSIRRLTKREKEEQKAVGAEPVGPTE